MRAIERTIPGRLTDALNQGLYRAAWQRALAFYRPTHAETVIAEARNPRRYMMPGIGYAPTVYRRFLDGHDRFAGVISRAELQTAFGGTPGSLDRSDARFDGLMARRYGEPGS